MAHELDTKQSFMSAREVAWHRLGTVKSTWFTAEEALTEALLGYHVYKGNVVATLTMPDGTEVMVEAPDWASTLRQHPETGQWEVLGVVGKDYETFQNMETFNFMDEVVGNIGGAHYETAGALRGGRQLFMSVSTESADIILDKNGRNDHIKTYILCYTSHDASLALTVQITPTRVVCANTLAMAMREQGRYSNGRWSTRHIGDIKLRAQDAKSVLGIYHSHTELLETQATKMIQTDMSDNTFSRCLDDLFVIDEKDVMKEKDREAMDMVRGLYELSPTNANVTGTVWGGLQATIEYADWLRGNLRGSDKVTINESRFRRQIGMDNTRDDFKQRAWDRFMAEVAA